MAELPSEAERLLAVAPADFVEERKALARKLRDDGRPEEAALVAEIRKPTPVVLAVNRAARDRPQAVKDAAKAAERLARAQLSGKPESYSSLVEELAEASALLNEVAMANLSVGGRVSEAMQRRAAAHIRGALASDDARKLLVRGALTDEIEASGFAAFAGLPVPKRRGKARADRATDRKRGERERELRTEIARSRGALREAEQRVTDAVRNRDELAAELRRLEAARDELREP
jgi:hypothetical protein